ncbi:hypothetical protein F8388_019696 [Cannabis sativa]|uniref:DC1 domain-containing protein n=1 Tax=Cannabis sativa TaxID=3483 RepID=A0A7J6FGJ3_CANSA|nr:hypothetical protein F8388_019696 [Cannabis sativa]
MCFLIMDNDQHFCHEQHSLHLIMDGEIITNDEISCELCEFSVEQPPYYVCDSCKYYVHKSCEELPKQINHSFHPRHPFILTSRSVPCDSCWKTPQTSIMFCCEECGFDMDIECALMSNSITTCPNEGQYCIQHSSHPHLLLLVDTTDAIYTDVNVRCFACQFEDSTSDVSGVYYGCNRCEYFLPKHCIDQLPQQIQTSHQPNHNLLSLHMKGGNVNVTLVDIQWKMLCILNVLNVISNCA